MYRWQYSILVFNNRRGDVGALNVQLAALGNDGWEIASIIPDMNYLPEPWTGQKEVKTEMTASSAVILKRPIPEDEPQPDPIQPRIIGFAVDPA